MHRTNPVLSIIIFDFYFYFLRSIQIPDRIPKAERTLNEVGKLLPSDQMDSIQMQMTDLGDDTVILVANQRLASLLDLVSFKTDYNYVFLREACDTRFQNREKES
jgi:hypothetical protein